MGLEQNWDQLYTFVVLIVSFQVKHFLADFLFQTRYVLAFRHIYGHPAGLLHVGIHAFGSAVVLWFLPMTWILFAGILVVEAIVHYHIDWSKEQFNRRLQLTTQNNLFWITLGFDQLLHQLTYVGMIAWLICVA